jgi:hypothetical protein
MLIACSRPPVTRSSQSSAYLAAYFDLHSDQGPIHARVVGDTGRRFLAGAPLRSYQCHPPALLRRCLAVDIEKTGDIRDPLDIVPEDRSPEWTHLCDRVAGWEQLDVPDRLAVAQVLDRLGFWARLISLMPDGEDPGESGCHAQLAHLRRVALNRLCGEDLSTDADTYSHMAAVAADVSRPGNARLTAFTNLVVHHGRSDHDVASMQRWYDASLPVLADGADAVGPLLLSFYWRGMSFIPFFRKDWDGARAILDDAEAYAQQALTEATADDRLAALDNLFPLLETRGRAAAAIGDPAAAERYYRALVDLDPVDSRTHLKLAEFFKRSRRYPEARCSYERAMVLGAPCTVYARSQLASLRG